MTRCSAPSSSRSLFRLRNDCQYLDGRPLARPGYCDEHHCNGYDVALYDPGADHHMNQQRLAQRLLAAALVGVLVVFWSTSFVSGVIIAAVVLVVAVLLF